MSEEKKAKIFNAYTALMARLDDVCKKCRFTYRLHLYTGREWICPQPDSKPPSKELVKSVQEVWERDYKDDNLDMPEGFWEKSHKETLKIPDIKNPSEQDFYKCVRCMHIYEEKKYECPNCGCPTLIKEKEVAEPLAGSALQTAEWIKDMADGKQQEREWKIRECKHVFDTYNPYWTCGKCGYIEFVKGIDVEKEDLEWLFRQTTRYYREDRDGAVNKEKNRKMKEKYEHKLKGTGGI